MSTDTTATHKSRHTADAQITIDARDVLAGRWDDVHMEAGR